MAKGGAVRQAWYVTESSPNTFQRLPVRGDVYVLVGIAVFAEATALEKFRQSHYESAAIATTLAKRLAQPPVLHRVAPTARSALHL